MQMPETESKFDCIKRRQSFFHGESSLTPPYILRCTGIQQFIFSELPARYACLPPSRSHAEDRQASCASDFISRLKSGKSPPCRAENRLSSAARTHIARRRTSHCLRLRRPLPDCRSYLVVARSLFPSFRFLLYLYKSTCVI